MTETEDGYLPCVACGEWIDDGSNRNGEYLCHDCDDIGLNEEVD